MKNLASYKQWYVDAVTGALVLRGITKNEAQSLMDKYKLQERLDTYPDIQLHYDIEATVEEILKIA